MVPEKRYGSWRTMDRVLLRESNFTFRRSTPSISMDPSWGSYSRPRRLMMEDLPAPVGPNMARRSPGWASNEMSWRTG